MFKTCLKKTAIKIYEAGQFVRKPSHLMAALGSPRFTPGTDDEHLKATLDWLCRAQDYCATGGVSAGYSFKRGWMPPYPETTGYIIPTFLAAADYLAAPSYRERALRMGDWECAEQLPSGAVRGGIGLNPYPIVFNTGQVIFGWLALYRATTEQRFLEAARNAADWLVDVQDADGAWRLYTYMDTPHVYHARVAWALLETYNALAQDKYLVAACRHITWVLDQAQPNGWFKHMGFSPDQAPPTHTIAYTLRGLLEAAPYLGTPLQDRAEQAVLNVLQQLLTPTILQQMPLLPATFTPEWIPNARYSCLTGTAQLAIICYKLAAHPSHTQYAPIADQLVYQLQTTQDRRNSNPGIRGGMAGSHPLGGDYVPYTYLNWAAKFFIDALLLKIRRSE